MQQINLYRFLPKPIRSVLDVKVFALLWGVFFVMLMLEFVYDAIGERVQVRHLAAITTLTNQARARIEMLAVKYPQLNAEPKPLKAGPSEACKNTLSPYLTGLAKASVRGVWLTEINIAKNGHDIALKGRALEASAVKHYLTLLKQQPVFSAVTFELQDLTEDSVAGDTPATAKEMHQVLGFSIGASGGPANG